MSPNDADGMANSVDPDQTAPLGAVWPGTTLFAQTCLSENLGKLRLWGLTTKYMYCCVRGRKLPSEILDMMIITSFSSTNLF